MAKAFHELALISVPQLSKVYCDGQPALLGQAAAECLTQFGFSKVDLIERFEADPQNFEITLGDLTEDGLAFARAGFQRWLINSDRWKTDRTIKKYKRALTKQIEKSRSPRI